MKRKMVNLMEAISKRPILSILVVFGFIASQTMVGYAIWLISLDGVSTATITSEGSPLSWDTEFTLLNMDATNGITKQNTTAIISNSDGDVDAVISWNISTSDVDDSCTDYINDVSAKVFYEGSEVSNEDIVVVSDLDEIMVEWQAQRFSCPQTKNLTMQLTQA